MFRMTIDSLSCMVFFNELIEFVFRVKVIVCPPTVKSLSICSHLPLPVDTRFCLLIFLSGSQLLDRDENIELVHCPPEFVSSKVVNLHKSSQLDWSTGTVYWHHVDTMPIEYVHVIGQEFWMNVHAI